MIPRTLCLSDSRIKAFVLLRPFFLQIYIYINNPPQFFICFLLTGRAFFQWHDLACQRLRAKFGSIQAGRTSMSSLVDELKHDVERAETNQSLLSVAPTKRLTGKKYVQEVERQRDGAMSKATAQIVRPTERAYNHLRVNELRNMKCPCFQVFHFARVTYRAVFPLNIAIQTEFASSLLVRSYFWGRMLGTR